MSVMTIKQLEKYVEEAKSTGAKKIAFVGITDVELKGRIDAALGEISEISLEDAQGSLSLFSDKMYEAVSEEYLNVLNHQSVDIKRAVIKKLQQVF